MLLSSQSLFRRPGPRLSEKPHHTAANNTKAAGRTLTEPYTTRSGSIVLKLIVRVQGCTMLNVAVRVQGHAMLKLLKYKAGHVTELHWSPWKEPKYNRLEKKKKKKLNSLGFIFTECWSFGQVMRVFSVKGLREPFELFVKRGGFLSNYFWFYVVFKFAVGANFHCTRYTKKM